MSTNPALEVVERDIDFDAVLNLVRAASTSDAAGLLHSALKVAFNNGEAFGMESMAKFADDTFARLSMTAPAEEQPQFSRETDSSTAQTDEQMKALHAHSSGMNQS